MEKIKIDLGFGVLVAEVNESSTANDSPQREITISLEDKEGAFIQDIALVGQAIHPHTKDAIPDSVRCLVWTNPQDESYTHEYVIEKYKSED